MVSMLKVQNFYLGVSGQNCMDDELIVADLMIVKLLENASPRVTLIVKMKIETEFTDGPFKFSNQQFKSCPEGCQIVFGRIRIFRQFYKN